MHLVNDTRASYLRAAPAITADGNVSEDLAGVLVDVELGLVFGDGVDLASGLQIDVRHRWGPDHPHQGPRA